MTLPYKKLTPNVIFIHSNRRNINNIKREHQRKTLNQENQDSNNLPTLQRGEHAHSLMYLPHLQTLKQHFPVVFALRACYLVGGYSGLGVSQRNPNSSINPLTIVSCCKPFTNYYELLVLAHVPLGWSMMLNVVDNG